MHTLTFTEYNFDQLVCDVVNSSTPYYLAGVRSQLNPLNWLYMLSEGETYDIDTHYVLDGVLNGFHVVDDCPNIEGYFCRNYASCYSDENLKKLRKLVDSECNSGKLTLVHKPCLCTHALGVIRKKDTRKIRPITDCKRPIDLSVNNFTDHVWERFSFVTVEAVVGSILEGKHFVSTIDLANAYRSVLITPENRQYFGLELDGVYYRDNFLCFGSRAAPFVFNRLTDTISRYMGKLGITCYNYLDDLICLSSTYDKGVQDQLTLLRQLRKLGFYISWEKVVSPSQVATYLGIEIDTVEMKMRLPEEKIQKLRKELEFWHGKNKATYKQLQILAGHLSHGSRMIQGGKLYMYFLFDLLKKSEGKRRVKLTPDFHRDLSWWWVFLEEFNSVPISDIKSQMSWLTFFDAGDCVCVSSPQIDIITQPLIGDDVVVSYVKHKEVWDLYLPEEIVGDLAAREIGSLWIYLMENPSIINTTISVLCCHKYTYVCLKKYRHKNVLVSLILRHVFWWSLAHNVNLKFRYDPFFS